MLVGERGRSISGSRYVSGSRMSLSCLFEQSRCNEGQRTVFAVITNGVPEQRHPNCAARRNCRIATQTGDRAPYAVMSHDDVARGIAPTEVAGWR
jgi:hypothetical protein